MEISLAIRYYILVFCFFHKHGASKNDKLQVQYHIYLDLCYTCDGSKISLRVKDICRHHGFLKATKPCMCRSSELAQFAMKV